MIGGSAHGVGNMHPGVEFNFGLDPSESTFTVLNSTKPEKPILLLPIETISKYNISEVKKLFIKF